MNARDELCGYTSPKQGEHFAPTSPCVRAAGHVEYHFDDSGLPFGPWVEGGPRLVQDGLEEAEALLDAAPLGADE